MTEKKVFSIIVGDGIDGRNDRLVTAIDSTHVRVDSRMPDSTWDGWLCFHINQINRDNPIYNAAKTVCAEWKAEYKKNEFKYL